MNLKTKKLTAEFEDLNEAEIRILNDLIPYDHGDFPIRVSEHTLSGTAEASYTGPVEEMNQALDFVFSVKSEYLFVDDEGEETETSDWNKIAKWTRASYDLEKEYEIWVFIPESLRERIRMEKEPWALVRRWAPQTGILDTRI